MLSMDFYLRAGAAHIASPWSPCFVVSSLSLEATVVARYYKHNAHVACNDTPCPEIQLYPCACTSIMYWYSISIIQIYPDYPCISTNQPPRLRLCQWKCPIFWALKSQSLRLDNGEKTPTETSNHSHWRDDPKKHETTMKTIALW